METEIRPLTSKEVIQAFRLEEDGYPPAEGASLEDLSYRQREAPDLFIGMFEGQDLIAFVCGTRDYCLRAESLKTHDPKAPCVCVHSVCVHRGRRRKGLALTLLKAYHNQVKQKQEKVIKFCLMAKASLIPLYSRAGYTLVGKSDIVHGKDTWYELEMFV